MTRLAVEALTAEGFAPFGRVVEEPARAPDAAGPSWRWWAETASLASDGRAFGVGYVSVEPGELRFEWAERHMRSPELVVPAGGECLIYAGPPEHADEPGRLPPLESFRAFRLAAGQGALLEAGVWHGAPLALDGPVGAFVFLLEGTGQNDVHVVRFPEAPVEVEP